MSKTILPFKWRKSGKWQSLRILNFRKFLTSSTPTSGREDRKTMSEPKPQRAPKARKPKKPKTEVTVKVENETKKKRRAKQRAPKTEGFAEACKEIGKLRREIRKIKGDEKGPRTQSTMATTVTLGPISGNPSDSLSRSHRHWLSPILLKTQDSGTAATPLTTRASQYNLYKILKAELVIQPLVGKSMVTGTVIMADVDQESSSAKPDTVDSVKARPHVEIPLGVPKRWRLPAATLRGPREGWWLVDTNEQPTSSLGPAINIWTYLQTRNLMGTTNEETTFYLGKLALAEIRVVYAFANYNPKPALAELMSEKEEMKTEAASFVNNSDDDSLMVEVDSQNLFMGRIAERDGEQKSGKGSTFWSVAGDVINTVSPALGPWGWLVRGGFLFLRRIFGRGAAFRQGKNYYQVYASIEDAARDLPIYQKLQAKNAKWPEGNYWWQQINSENLTTSSTTIIPRDRWIELGGNYLPLNLAPDPENIPPPAYGWKPDGEFTNGFPGQLGPPAGGDTPFDNTLEFFGDGVWYWLDEGEHPQYNNWIKFTTTYGQGVPGGSSWFLEGGHLNYYDLSEFGAILGHNEARAYGVVHTMSSMFKALGKEYAISESTWTPQMPSQMFLHLSTWSTSKASWERFLAGIRGYGEQTIITPVKINEGYLGNEVTREGEAADARATGLMLFNLTTHVAGILFVTDDYPESAMLQHHRVSAVNVRKHQHYEARAQCYTPHVVTDPEAGFLDDTGERHATHPAPVPPPKSKSRSSSITHASETESEPEYEMVKKKKKHTEGKQ